MSCLCNTTPRLCFLFSTPGNVTDTIVSTLCSSKFTHVDILFHIPQSQEQERKEVPPEEKFLQTPSPRRAHLTRHTFASNSGIINVDDPHLIYSIYMGRVFQLFKYAKMHNITGEHYSMLALDVPDLDSLMAAREFCVHMAMAKVPYNYADLPLCLMSAGLQEVGLPYSISELNTRSLKPKPTGIWRGGCAVGQHSRQSLLLAGCSACLEESTPPHLRLPGGEAAVQQGDISRTTV